MVIVEFTKKFHAGILKGFEIRENLKFPSGKESADWIRKVTEKGINRKLNYTLENVVVWTPPSH